MDQQPQKRWILWIDAVGAWLVCSSPRLSIGQATAENGAVDIPLIADVSRVHATLVRDAEAYLFESRRDAQVNGRPASQAVLKSGDLLKLGSLGMKFELPVRGSLSARLSVTGTQRLPLSLDGVLLLDDMLILGPGEQAHVRLPDVAEPACLFSQQGRLGMRWPGRFTVDKEPCDGRAMLPTQGCVSFGPYSMAIEPMGK